MDLETARRRTVRIACPFLFYVSQIANRPVAVISALPEPSATLAQWVGRDVPAIVPWLLSLVNGMAILGFLFGRISGLLPGRTGLFKGVIFGLIGWILMGLIYYPLIGLGPFAFQAGLGIAPALLSLAMLLRWSPT
jgi:hypothetical protein